MEDEFEDAADVALVCGDEVLELAACWRGFSWLSGGAVAVARAGK